jgi:hypothetical protein
MLKDVPVYACKVENLGERGAHLVAFKDFQSVWKQLNSTSMLSALANPMNSGDVGLPLDGGTMISGGEICLYEHIFMQVCMLHMEA